MKYQKVHHTVQLQMVVDQIHAGTFHYVPVRGLIGKIPVSLNLATSENGLSGRRCRFSHGFNNLNLHDFPLFFDIN